MSTEGDDVDKEDKLIKNGNEDRLAIAFLTDRFRYMECEMFCCFLRIRRANYTDLLTSSGRRNCAEIGVNWVDATAAN